MSFSNLFSRLFSAEIEKVGERLEEVLVKIPFLFSEKLERFAFRADERSQAPGQLASHEKKDHDPEPENRDACFGVDFLFFTRIGQRVDDVFHAEYSREGDDGHVQQLDEGVIITGDQKKTGRWWKKRP